MLSLSSRPGWISRIADQWVRPWWHIVHLGALLLALATLPSTYRREARPALARHLVGATLPMLPWFTLLAALATVVIVRIVLVTALSYGLSQYALEMVVRVLVLELVPLTAGLFVALRWSVAAGSALAQMRRDGRLTAMRREGIDVLRTEVLPRALAGFVAVLLLAALSGVVALVLTYLLAHGFSPWGLEGYTRMVGQVFSPPVTIVFVGKSLALAMAVALLPLGSALHDPGAGRSDEGGELQGLVRLASAILLIEVGSLMINYA
jgi:phospholipid/cholesterol/gamma-HCH transport system permease protein